ncbi:MAG: LpxL/LpxP family acyltransferase [Rhodospirillales bacterium]
MAARGPLGQWWLRYVLQPLRRWGMIGTMEFLRLFPVDRAGAAFGRFARLVGPWSGASNRARRNLEIAFPGIARDERERIVRAMWDNLARVVCEYGHLDTIFAERAARIEIVNPERLDALRDDGRPGILFSAHLASFEMITVAAAMRGLNVAVVYRNANNLRLDEYIRRKQSVTGAEQIRKSARGARRLVEVMRGGGHAVLIVDQKLNDGIAVPFFGKPAMTSPALAQLALRYGCPVLPVRVERAKDSRYRVVCEQPLTLPRSGDQAADVLALMTAVNRTVEDWIRARPEHWLWLHRRWPRGTV